MSVQRFLPYLAVITLSANCSNAFAQAMGQKQQTRDSVFIDGHVLDDIGEPMIGAVIELKAGAESISGALTNEEGYFHLYHPPVAGKKASIRVYYQSYKTKEIPLGTSPTPHLIKMELDPNWQDKISSGCGYYKVPLIDPYAPTQRSLTSEEIEKMAR